MEFAGKVVWVTGGGRGMGRVLAKSFAERGAKVAITGRQAPILAETQAALSQGGANVAAFAADVKSQEQVKAAHAALVERLGPVDILVNNAGNFLYKGFLDHSLQDWEDAVGVHMTGAFHCSQAVLPAMVDRKSGSIVNIASVYGLVPSPKVSAQCAVKAGLIGLTKALAAEFKEHRIRVNAVCPGAISHKPRPEGGAEPGQDLHAEDVAATVLFLASPAASQVTGAALEVWGKTEAAVKVRGGW